MLLQISLLSLIILIVIFERSCCSRLKKLRNKLSNFVFWNGTIRIFLEVYLELFLFSLMDIAVMESLRENEEVKKSNQIALVTMLISVASPIFLLTYFCRRRDQVQRESFLNRVGSFVEGTKTHTDSYFWANILVPSFFIVRRSILCLSLIYQKDWLCVQLFVA